MRPVRQLVLAECEERLYGIELGASGEPDVIATEELAGQVPVRFRPRDLVPSWAERLLVDCDAVGSTVVLLLDRRPPLLVSHDLGRTWTERGSGLPRGAAIALGENPDHVVVASGGRLYVSLDGGVFWRSLDVELPEIADVAWGPGHLDD